MWLRQSHHSKFPLERSPNTRLDQLDAPYIVLQLERIVFNSTANKKLGLTKN